MNIVTIKAKARLAAIEIDKHLGGEENIYWIKDAPKVYANIIEDVFIPPVLNKKPLYSMSAFSAITGIKIIKIVDPCNIACAVPLQFPDSETTVSKNAVKEQTERVARIILASLNEA